MSGIQRRGGRVKRAVVTVVGLVLIAGFMIWLQGSPPQSTFREPVESGSDGVDSPTVGRDRTTAVPRPHIVAVPSLIIELRFNGQRVQTEAVVDLWAQHASMRTTKSSAGRAEFMGVPSGPARYRIDHPEFIIREGEIELADGDTRIELELTQSFIVAATVQNATEATRLVGQGRETQVVGSLGSLELELGEDSRVSVVDDSGEKAPQTQRVTNPGRVPTVSIHVSLAPSDASSVLVGVKCRDTWVDCRRRSIRWKSKVTGRGSRGTVRSKGQGMGYFLLPVSEVIEVEELRIEIDGYPHATLRLDGSRSYELQLECQSVFYAKITPSAPEKYPFWVATARADGNSWKINAHEDGRLEVYCDHLKDTRAVVRGVEFEDFAIQDLTGTTEANPRPIVMKWLGSPSLRVTCTGIGYSSDQIEVVLANGAWERKLEMVGPLEYWIEVPILGHYEIEVRSLEEGRVVGHARVDLDVMKNERSIPLGVVETLIDIHNSGLAGERLPIAFHGLRTWSVSVDNRRGPQKIPVPPGEYRAFIGIHELGPVLVELRESHAVILDLSGVVRVRFLGGDECPTVSVSALSTSGAGGRARSVSTVGPELELLRTEANPLVLVSTEMGWYTLDLRKTPAEVVIDLGRCSGVVVRDGGHVEELFATTPAPGVYYGNRHRYDPNRTRIQGVGWLEQWVSWEVVDGTIVGILERSPDGNISESCEFSLTPQDIGEIDRGAGGIDWKDRVVRVVGVEIFDVGLRDLNAVLSKSFRSISGFSIQPSGKLTFPRHGFSALQVVVRTASGEEVALPVYR